MFEDTAMRLVFMLVGCLPTMCGQELVCPSSDWQLSGDTCYYVDSATAQSWDSANLMCQSLGGENSRLASIYSENENSVIYDIKSTSGNDDNDIWLGLSQCQEAMSSSNSWYWYDKEPYSYTNWQPGQPSTEEVCAVASLDTENSQWRVEDCLFTHGVGCEVPKLEDTCPDGFEEFSSSCYYVNPNFQLNHDGAVSYCTGHDENAHLASILTEEEAMFIDQLARDQDPNENQEYWIGLYKNVKDEKWNWLSGSNKTVEFWEQTEPQDDDPTRLCSYLASTLNGEWFSAPCSHDKPYVCKMPIDAGCKPGDGWVKLNNNSCLYFATEEFLNQNEAFKACKSLHVEASLVWIENEEENNFIMQEFEPLGTDPWLGYIKCNRSNPDATWIWLDAGSPVGPDGYVNFQSDGSTDDDNICAHMSADGSWIHSPCDSPYGYVCQTPAVMQEATTAPTTDDDSTVTTTSSDSNSTSRTMDMTTDTGNLLSASYLILHFSLLVYLGVAL